MMNNVVIIMGLLCVEGSPQIVQYLGHLDGFGPRQEMQMDKEDKEMRSSMGFN